MRDLEFIFNLDAPLPKGGDMRIDKLGRDPKSGQTRYRIDFPYRRPDGKASHLKRIALGSGDLAAKIAEIKSLTVGSLTSKTFAECVEHYQKHVGFGSKSDCFEKALEKLGKFKVDRRFPSVYYSYILQIKHGRAVNTVNNHRICIRSVILFAYKSGLISEQPVRDFGMEKMEERDRVWTTDERLRIYNAMQACESHLYWSVRFAEKNPIRSSDLWGLTKDNLELFGENAPCIKFFPSKTRERQDRPTYLIELDQDIIEQFQWQIRELPDCNLLFPHFWYSNKEKKWKWQLMGHPKRHWNYLMHGSPNKDGFRGAQVKDFHFHDLRHVATTYMLERRDSAGQRIYDEDDMRDLGILYSHRAVEIYRNRKADRVIQRVRRSTFVAPKIELAVKNG